MTIDLRLKITLLSLADALVIVACQYTTLVLLEESYKNSLTPAMSALAFIASGWVAGFYSTSISHLGIGAVKLAAGCTLASSAVVYLLNESIPLAIFSSVLVLLGVIAYRVTAREFLFERRRSGGKKTLVYGAGSAGVQFVTASMQSNRHDVVGYVDDSAELVGTTIHGRTVYHSKQIKKLVERNAVKIVVLALPSVTRRERTRIIESLLSLPVRVVTVPTFEDLIEGKQRITQTEDISVEDLLGREPVPPMKNFMTARTTGKVCLVTGAGGSIGSELCRQIGKWQPKHLILLDVSEPALFAIEQELLRGNNTNISCYLGSVTNLDLIKRVFREHPVSCVFHAAAYKHVPMVESNPLAGLINNVEGTQNVLNAALASECESFTLISTDKAVRPTNIMGATKRIAEMACQVAAESNSGATIISMVRFGNVLGSSGSVIPTFQRQIKQGGPVTLTHPDITRYFMTIPEAAELVIQSAGMAKTGDLFLLDMGTPIKIYDLAERLIRLSGKSMADAEGDNSGDIEIKITGLRPGEKLYEELLVDATAKPTDHPKIMRAREQHLSHETLTSGIGELVTHLNRGNIDQFKLALSNIVAGYQPTDLQQDA